ncbi:hypothetical protein BT69DRAFT_1362953 [Atractiella rhizophila]|nr:hypothetical protein BT69DRAFT_1362953 [Atractiella rhizophila]
MASGVEVVPKVDLERLLACEASFMRETDTVSRNRSVFNSWVEACHRAERRVGELQREVDKLKMEKDVLEEETRAVTDEHNELHNRLNFGLQPTQPQKWPREADGATELIQLAKDRSAAMKDRINMLFDQSMDLNFENAPPRTQCRSRRKSSRKIRTTNAAINSSDASVCSSAFNSLRDDIIFKIIKEGKDLNIDRGEWDLAMNSYLQVLSKANKPNLSRDLRRFIDFIKDAHDTSHLRAVSNGSAAWFDEWPI